MKKGRAIPLTTWFIIREGELEQFVGRDLIVFYRGEYFVLIKDATLELIQKYYDEKSLLIDLSDSKYLNVELNLPPLPEGL